MQHWKWTKDRYSSNGEESDDSSKHEHSCHDNCTDSNDENVEKEKSNNLTNLLDAATLCDVFENTDNQHDPNERSSLDNQLSGMETIAAAPMEAGSAMEAGSFSIHDAKAHDSVHYRLPYTSFHSWRLTQQSQHQSMFRQTQLPSSSPLESALLFSHDETSNRTSDEISGLASEHSNLKVDSDDIDDIDYNVERSYICKHQESRNHPQVIQSSFLSSSESLSEKQSHVPLATNENERGTIPSVASAIKSETQHSRHMIGQHKLANLKSPPTDRLHVQSPSVIDAGSGHSSSNRSSVVALTDGEASDNDEIYNDDFRVANAPGEHGIGKAIGDHGSGESSKEKDRAKNEGRTGTPNKFDVLCGQSQLYSKHSGNRRFQIILQMYAPKYEAARNKQEKMELTKEIVACIHSSGGRFLKRNKCRKSAAKNRNPSDEQAEWVEIPNVTARDKVSHALRTKMASTTTSVQSISKLNDRR